MLNYKKLAIILNVSLFTILIAFVATDISGFDDTIKTETMDTLQIIDEVYFGDNPTPSVSVVTLSGFAYVVHRDGNGNIISEQTVHNRFVDTGEEFLLDAVFQDGGTDVADSVQIGAICIGDQGTVVVSETETASDFDGDNGITETNCKEDVTVTTSGGTAIIGPLTFTCGGTNCADSDTITGIAICQNDVTDDNDFNNCATEGIMFAVIDITDVTLQTSDTVDITYTFDISSSGN